MKRYNLELMAALANSSYRNINQFAKENFPDDYASKGRAIRKYAEGSRVPNIEIAKKLLDLLGVEVSLQDLISSLKQAQEYRIDIGSDNYSYPTLIKSVTIKADILKDVSGLVFTSGDIKRMVDNRIYETTKTGNPVEYVAKLIAADINREILERVRGQKNGTQD